MWPKNNNNIYQITIIIYRSLVRSLHECVTARTETHDRWRNNELPAETSLQTGLLWTQIASHCLLDCMLAA